MTGRPSGDTLWSRRAAIAAGHSWTWGGRLTVYENTVMFRPGWFSRWLGAAEWSCRRDAVLDVFAGPALQRIERERPDSFRPLLTLRTAEGCHYFVTMKPRRAVAELRRVLLDPS